MEGQPDWCSSQKPAPRLFLVRTRDSGDHETTELDTCVVNPLTHRCLVQVTTESKNRRECFFLFATSLQLNMPLSIEQSFSNSTVLLTGGLGGVGSTCLEQLLRQTEVTDC